MRRFNAKIFLTAAVAAIGLTAAASAADLPRIYKKVPVAPAVPTWTGFYAGIEGGGAWGRTDDVHGFNEPIGIFQTTLGVPIASLRPDGGFAGFTAGYNWQFSQWVAGVEADYSFTFGLKDSAFPTNAQLFNTNYLYTVKQSDLSTYRGRVGYLVRPDLLLYATGGAALAHITVENVASFGPPAPFVPFGSLSEGHADWGWTAGAGAEWRFMPNLSAKFEYLHVGFDTKSYFNPAGTATGFYFSDQRVRLSEDILRVGLNYHFSGPIVAKY